MFGFMCRAEPKTDMRPTGSAGKQRCYDVLRRHIVYGADRRSLPWTVGRVIRGAAATSRGEGGVACHVGIIACRGASELSTRRAAQFFVDLFVAMLGVLLLRKRLRMEQLGDDSSASSRQHQAWFQLWRGTLAAALRAAGRRNPPQGPARGCPRWRVALRILR